MYIYVIKCSPLERKGGLLDVFSDAWLQRLQGVSFIRVFSPQQSCAGVQCAL